MAANQRVLSGMRPTGRMHLGHLAGVLTNWVRLQDEYDCYYFVADWHALTTHYADTSGLTENTFQMVVDWLAVGLDPDKATFFVQSWVPEHAELHLLFSMVTPLGWLERVPTYKEQRENIRDRDLGNYGFLGYPVLQAADILIYRAHFVPVGEDQVAHVELTREIARRFNSVYPFPYPYPRESLFADAEARGLAESQVPEVKGKRPDLAREGIAKWLGEMDALARGRGFEALEQVRIPLEHFLVFPEPRALLTPTPRVPGLDGRRMSKSYGNNIDIADDADTVREKIRGMHTDPQRERRGDPGRPEICPVFSFHQLYSPAGTVEQIAADCRGAAIGCVDCKKKMAANLLPVLEPIQERRRRYEDNPGEVWEILTAGTRRAQQEARRTMREVRQAMQLVPVVTRELGTTEPATIDLDLEE